MSDPAPGLRIEARRLGKRFARQCIVRDFTHDFTPGSVTAISGPNGSGKSTLLRLLSAQLLPSEGDVGFSVSGIAVPDERRYRSVALTGPYLELIEELTGEELVASHARVRGLRQNLQPADLWARLSWTKGMRRQRIASYSSGMKQRVRLLLAMATEAGAVMLDEPTSNLDAEGVGWYRDLLADWTAGRTLLIASNEERDFPQDAARITRPQWISDSSPRQQTTSPVMCSSQETTGGVRR